MSRDLQCFASTPIDSPQLQSLTQQPLNDALIYVAQEVAELLEQAYPVQADDIDYLESTTRKHFSQSPLMQ